MEGSGDLPLKISVREIGRPVKSEKKGTVLCLCSHFFKKIFFCAQVRREERGKKGERKEQKESEPKNNKNEKKQQLLTNILTGIIVLKSTCIVFLVVSFSATVSISIVSVVVSVVVWCCL